MRTLLLVILAAVLVTACSPTYSAYPPVDKQVQSVGDSAGDSGAGDGGSK